MPRVERLDLSNIHNAARVFSSNEKIMKLLFKSRLIHTRRDCPNGDCDGRLKAKKYLGKRFKNHGGWAYKCDGAACRGRRPRTILQGSILHHTKFSLKELMWMFYYYANVNHRVCAHLRVHCFMHSIILCIRPSYDVCLSIIIDGSGGAVFGAQISPRNSVEVQACWPLVPLSS